MAVSLPTFPPFQVHLDGNVGPRWKKWLARFENLIVGMGIEDAKQKRALLLHYSGPEVDEIFDTLEDTGEDKDYKKAVEKLTAHFNPQVNTTYEVYKSEKLSKTKAKVSTASTQDSELLQRPVNLQTPIKKSRSKLF